MEKLELLLYLTATAPRFSGNFVTTPAAGTRGMLLYKWYLN